MRTDQELHRDVVAELNWQPALRDEEIGVAVKGGVVTLSGEVTSYARKFEAERAAESVHGVKAVAIDLNVKLPHSFVHSDTEIAHAALQPQLCTGKPVQSFLFGQLKPSSAPAS